MIFELKLKADYRLDGENLKGTVFYRKGQKCKVIEKK